MAHQTHPSLVTTEWLSDHLDDENLTVVEVDEDTTTYVNVGHIPGALLWDWKEDLQHPVRRDYLDRKGLQDLLGRSGVDSEGTVVLYGGNSNWFAAYAYWLLKLRGFNRVKLLDGGRAKWALEGRVLVPGAPPVPTPTTPPQLGEAADQLRALRPFVLESLADARFIDVRSPQEFSGEVLAPPHLPEEQPYVGGHVPGAFNIPWSKAVKEDGSFRSTDELSELYSPVLKGSPDAPVIAYCRIGERAAHTWFVLHELLGVQRARNYDGSWTEYGSLVGVPVEAGENK